MTYTRDQVFAELAEDGEFWGDIGAATANAWEALKERTAELTKAADTPSVDALKRACLADADWCRHADKYAFWQSWCEQMPARPTDRIVDAVLEAHRAQFGPH